MKKALPYIFLAALVAASCSQLYPVAPLGVYPGTSASNVHVSQDWQPKANDELDLGREITFSGDKGLPQTPRTANKLHSKSTEPSGADASANKEFPLAEESTMTLEYVVGDESTLYENASLREEMTLIVQMVGDAHLGLKATLQPLAGTEDDDSMADTLTLETTSVDAVLEWSDRMVHRGYAVTIDYDRKTGIYHCTAVKMRKKKKEK